MFPEIDVEMDLEEVEDFFVPDTVSTTLGRVPLYDFKQRRYVVVDGKIVEATQEEAVRQWVAFLILTKMDKYKTLQGTGFGTYIENYIGLKRNNLGFVVAEIEREIKEKAELCAAISYIDGFEYEQTEGALKIWLTVHMHSGDEVEVVVDDIGQG